MPVFCITGANRGIGLKFVRQLAKSPENIILALTRSLSSDLADLKVVTSPTTHILECDVGNIESIQSFVQRAGETLEKGPRIDFLINNAGVNGTLQRNSLSLEADALLSQIKINVLGPAKTAQFLLEAGLLADHVRILNITLGLASFQIITNVKPRKLAGYSISKAALNMLTVHQAEDIRSKLSGAVVILMDPGWVKTRLGGSGAASEPCDSV